MMEEEKRFEIHPLARPCLNGLKPYFYKDFFYNHKDYIKLSDNENPYVSDYGRYPNHSPHFLQDLYVQYLMKEPSLPLLDGYSGILKTENIIFGNGSSEIIDVTLRAFCEPRIDKICVTSPTFGLFQHIATAFGVDVVDVPLSGENYNKLDLEKILQSKAKVLFICQPTNPVGSTLDPKEILYLLKNFKGIIVLDECYIEFSKTPSFAPLVSHFNKLIVIRTFSKAWGLANLRVGGAVASENIINALACLKMPFSLSGVAQTALLQSFEQVDNLKMHWDTIKKSRDDLRFKLEVLKCVDAIFQSDTNFLLVKFKNHDKALKKLMINNIIVKSVDRILQDTIRITIGNEEENDLVFKTLETLS